MELTREDFELILDQKLDQKFQEFEVRMDAKWDAKLESRLAEQTRELKAYVQESFEAQQLYIDERFYELLEKVTFQAKVYRPSFRPAVKSP